MSSRPVDITRKRDAWMEATLDWVGASLGENPPATGDPAVRKEALLALDDVLHIIQAPHTAPVQRFFAQHTGRALEEIQGPPTAEGADIWKLYNHGFVVRTSSHTLCFDFFRGIHDMVVPLEQIEALSGAADAHFISHEHGDHLDLEMVTWMLRAGKPVVMPPALAAVWKEHEIVSRACQAREGVVQVGDLAVTVLPGHQTVGDSSWDNNWYLLEVDGVTICHTGDQSNAGDFAWIDAVRRDYHVDVLMTNCWGEELARVIEGVEPALTITGHENELSHPVSHRVSYQATYGRLHGLPSAYAIMSWGERVHFSPPDQLDER